MKRQGFTLIELLIVVAIIAILAAIAVPNFLEAQTRSRVSRTMNDLRTISLAMETYRIDNNTYAASEGDSPLGRPIVNGTASGRVEVDTRLLSTPISYVSSCPDDVFRRIAGKDADPNVGSLSPAYRVYARNYPDTSWYLTYPRNAWMTWSIGPDILSNTGGYRSLPYVIANEASTAPGIGMDKDGNPINNNGAYKGIRYDSTNGTVSYGDIYRFEGEAISSPN